MAETLIVNGVVIANGVADSDNDVLTKKDIKTIFMKYQRETDTMHTNIKNTGVEVFASWISEIETVIKGKVAPAGSWLATLKITNPNLIECIKNGKLNGFSLGSVSEKAMTPEFWFINKSLNYRDIKDIEEVIPLFISLVDKPANQYGFEVMTYDAYINKTEKMDVEDMTEVENKEEKISVSTFERIIDLLKVNKSESEEKVEEEEINKEETSETTESADETITALFDKLDTIIEQNTQILEGLNKAEEEVVDEEEEIEKAAEDEEEEEPQDEEVEKAEEDEEEASEEDEEVKVEKSESEEDDIHVDKRETNMIENQNIQNKTTFYQNTGRDSLGRKIRK